MKIQTMSVVVGGKACNAQCPFCVSKMTGEDFGIADGEVTVGRNFEKACRLAEIGGVTTILLTSKGEPTLYPNQIGIFLDRLDHWHFPFVELQTNGIQLYLERDGLDANHRLQTWHKSGLTTIIISVVHYDAAKNREIFTPDREQYIDLPLLIGKLHSIGFMVRLNVTMMSGYIDNEKKIDDFIKYSLANDVEQISIRPMRVPDKSENETIHEWAKQKALTNSWIGRIRKHFATEYADRKLMSLAHGAEVFDIYGVSVCFTDCLTREPEQRNELRQIIYYPDGRVAYDWALKGAILLPKEK
jgi:molybdenum cofactor biosynthesis enzyme MoaA